MLLQTKVMPSRVRDHVLLEGEDYMSLVSLIELVRLTWCELSDFSGNVKKKGNVCSVF